VALEASRKRAYRHLLYWALLEMRALGNPRHWDGASRPVLRAWVLAEWLHNLAEFSALDFAGFDEEQFWKKLAALDKEHPGLGLTAYQERFEQRLAKLKKS